MKDIHVTFLLINHNVKYVKHALPCKILKKMRSRDSVHDLWSSLQDAVDIKLDWDGAGGVSEVSLSLCHDLEC